MKKAKWLDRRIARPGPFLCLCLTEAEYLQALTDCNVKYGNKFISDRADATCHYLVNGNGETVAVVCLSGAAGRDPIGVAGLLIHEAVHVWQTYCDDMGEQTPGREQEAYAIQAISQELMQAFVDQTKGTTRG